MNVDPEQLREQLAVAQAHRDQVDRVIAWLEDGVEIFAGAPAPVELPAPAAPEAEREPEAVPPADPEPETSVEPAADLSATPPAVAPPARAGQRDLDGRVLGVIIKSNRPLSKAEILEAVPGPRKSVERSLQRLVRDGGVAAIGATKSRRYQKVAQEGFHTEARAKMEATAQRNAAKVDGRIARVVFRDKVAKAIAADPDALNEDRLAAALNADIEDVTEACAWLLERHQVSRNDDGTYTRNARRSVWTLTSEPFSEAHFATFPTALVEPCILAGTSEHGACASCGAPLRRVTETDGTTKSSEGRDLRPSATATPGASPDLRKHGGHHGSNIRARRTTGWEATCSCGDGDVEPCVVLDPFAGAGTTLMVALRLGRAAIGIELNPEYSTLARRRIRDDSPLINSASEVAA